jgi:hypothetical protein
MKEVKIIVWCDSCAGSERRTPATVSSTVSFGQSEPLMLDLCDACHSSVVVPLVQLLDEYGQPAVTIDKPTVVRAPGKISRSRGTLICPICSVTRSASNVVAEHIWRKHLGEERPPAPSVCPDCGYTPEAGLQRPTAAVGRHRANVHGYDPVAEAMAQYRERAGEPPTRKPA